jgi:hypothetical protein
MKEAPDYRGDRMDTAEGRGLARGRRFAYLSSLPADVLRAAGFDMPPSQLPAEFLDVQSKAVKEGAELMGFWLAWHQAGGFENLEAGGWNRATIFRKVRRFRSVFGEHPDVYEFPWIKLDLDAYWHASLLEALGIPDDTTES